MSTVPTVPRQTWLKCFKSLLTRLSEEDRETDQWTRRARRFSTLSGDLILPTENEILDREKSRIELFLFLDTSNSCRTLKKEFFQAAKTVPTKKIALRLFCFDTEVKETTLRSGKLFGGGGTSFSCIESWIQENTVKYPAAVAVFTDGDGDTVSPSKPERWHWFLSKNGTHNYIPKRSKIFNLSDIV